MRKSGLLGLPVEVSGWDDEGQFFVEYSTLDSGECGEKTLPLRRVVPARGLIFIRTLYADSFAKSHPEAHHVQMVEPSERLGYNKLYLSDCRPRHSAYEPKDRAEHLISVRDEVKR